jgi:8-amino-7-oxononanoate synthase
MELQHLESIGRLRATETLFGADRLHPTDSEGREVVCFASNDYLGLATHPALKQAATAALRDHGLGSAASRLVSGETPPHRALEDALAAFLGVEAALLFPTGYQANVGTLTALAGPQDFIASDAANHASLIDGCRLSRARVGIFDHVDADSAERALRDAPATARRRFILTESLFSMDGDRAPLAALAALARRADATLIVDEAHALGVLGPSGRGLCAVLGVEPEIRIGTLGKAFGSAGGFVAGSHRLRSLLLNRARTFIYTTAAPASLAAAALAALRIVESPEGDTLRAKLFRNLARIRPRLPVTAPLGHPTAPGHGPGPAPAVDQILPVILGPDTAATELAARLRSEGLLATAIRPPTVPENTARLRLTVSAAHTDGDLERLIRGLATALASAQAPAAVGASPRA